MNIVKFEKVSDSREAIMLQKQLKSQLILDLPKAFELRTVAGVDVSFPEPGMGLCVIIVLSATTLEIIELAHHFMKVEFPYISGLLSFREGPIFLETHAKINSQPDLYFFDGQGTAHPRGLGLASHMGLLLGKPSVGIAKSHLFGSYENPGLDKGQWSPIKDHTGNIIGAVLRTRTGKKPVFVSPGHLIDIKHSIELTLKFTTKYRIPEPTRLAHIWTQKLKRTISI
ncbi:endonuclease V [Kosmotoga arenicorallina S304]|uniref:Endonuclease V n=1 Tax=Kosmotoga arenicorallina S304 TaxID=1453497 RepID=A0A176K1J5_9BACT|nr:endonuclease V [Kosmotoga arenicorallina]OAA30833.1 endonuclease V [Kosmotoga arenicorallina S304]